MAKVAIGIPHQGSLHIELFASLMRMLQEPQGHECCFLLEELRPIEHARNTIIKTFLEGDADYLLFIDDDNPPIRNPLELVAFDGDIMGLPTPRVSHIDRGLVGGKVPIEWNVFGDYSKDLQGWKPWLGEMTGLQNVGAVGSGCLLIARRVLKKVRPAFVAGWHEDGTLKHDADLLFCRRAKKVGLKVQAHFGYRCRHYKRFELIDLLDAMHGTENP